MWGFWRVVWEEGVDSGWISKGSLPFCTTHCDSYGELKRVPKQVIVVRKFELQCL